MTSKFLENRLRNWSPKYRGIVFKVILWTIPSAALLFVLALIALPYVEFFNDMAAQPKGKALGTYGRTFGLDLAVDRLPPDGTLPRGASVWRFEGKEDATAVAAGKALVNPAKLTLWGLERGRKIFNVFCITCHGKYGEGDGPVVGPDRYPAPTNLGDKAVVAYPDGRIYHVISEGKGKMIGYKDKIDPDDRWHVVNYVRVLQRALNPSAEDLER